MGYKIKGGKLQRSSKLHPRAELAMAQQRDAFIKKFGRDPGPGDPLFFDPVVSTPTAISPETMRAETLAAMRRAGTPPQFVYAYEKTGLIVLEDGYEALSATDGRCTTPPWRSTGRWKNERRASIATEKGDVGNLA
jgi:hypothetical protein